MDFQDRRDPWRAGVDQNLASLNAGQRIWERELTVIRRLLGELDKLLRGDPERDTDGIVARLHNLEDSTNLIKGVLLRDRAGTKKDVISRLEAIESGERRSALWAKVAIALIAALAAVLGALLGNWGPISAFLARHNKLDPLDQAIENAREPKPRYRHYTIHEAPE